MCKRRNRKICFQKLIIYKKNNIITYIVLFFKLKKGTLMSNYKSLMVTSFFTEITDCALLISFFTFLI